LEKYILIFFLFLGHFSFAQDMDFSRVVTPQDQSPRTFEDQLVQWAWFNSPGNAIFKEQIEIAAKKKNLTWWELLDANVSFNLNEGNFIQDSIIRNNLFYPKYNFGLTFNLGAIASRPARTKIAEAEIRIAEFEEQQQKLRVRADVLQRYEDHELALQVLKSKTQAAEEGESIYTLVLEQFQNDKVDFKDFTAASSVYHTANEAKAVARTRVNKARISLEELIGIPWEKAVKRRRDRERKN